MTTEREHEHHLPVAAKREPLILRDTAITRKVNALFKVMATDAELRERFVKDPAQVLYEHVEGRSLPPQRASVTNQLVYSVLSNPKLLEWLAAYGEKHRHNPPPRHVFMNDFARAVIEHGGDHVVLSLIRGVIAQEGVMGLGGSSPAFFITSSPVIASGVIYKTDQETGLAKDLRSSQNFAQSTDHTHSPTSDTSSSATAAGTSSDTTTSSASDTSTSTGSASDTSTSTGSASDTSTSTSSESDTSTSTSSESDTSTSTSSESDTATSSSSESDTATSSETGTTTATSGEGIGAVNLYGSQYVRVTIDAMVRYANELLASGALNATDVVAGGERVG